MKRNMFRFLSLLLALCLCTGCALAQGFDAFNVTEGEGPRVHTVEQDEYPIYNYQADEMVPYHFPLYFLDGVKDLPYADLEAAVQLLNDLEELPEGEQRFDGIAEPENHTYFINQVDSAPAIMFNFAPEDQSILFLNYESFGTDSSKGVLDLVNSSGYDQDGLPSLLQHIPQAVPARAGESIVVSLVQYGIEIVEHEGKYLVPMHLAFDLLFCLRTHILNYFNGEAIFLVPSGAFRKGDELTEVGKLYFTENDGQRSETLAIYGVAELCLELDICYGLKKSHNINSFYDFLFSQGLLTDLLNPDGATADTALATLLEAYLDDLHTRYLMNSRYTGAGIVEYPKGISMLKDDLLCDIYEKAYSNAPKEIQTPYYECGDTAYVTFNEFQMSSDFDYYTQELTDELIAEDNVALTIYAHKQIYRENSPIKNVVLDLSNNSGGEVDAAAFTMCWFVGTAPLSIAHTWTGAQATTVYKADVNLDRTFDEKDWLVDKNTFCLISPASFSCGNLLPWVFRYSGYVTLIGEVSGGGSCAVLPMSTAWGTTYRISSPFMISFVKNGSFYDVDQGVEPQVHLVRPASFYDRQKLTDLINNLP